MYKLFSQWQSTRDHGQVCFYIKKPQRATYHLDVQFALGVVNWGQRLQEGKHDRLGAGPAADQQAHFDPLLVPHSSQLCVDVCPVPAEGATCTVWITLTMRISLAQFYSTLFILK